MTTPAAICLVNMDQRMTLFRQAVREADRMAVPLDQLEIQPKIRVNTIVAIFERFLSAVVQGLPLQLDHDAGDGLTVLEEFIVDRCECGAGLQIQAGDLYAAFKSWMASAYPEDTPPSMTAFGVALRGKFGRRVSNRIYYLGIGLKA